MAFSVNCRFHPLSPDDDMSVIRLPSLCPSSKSLEQRELVGPGPSPSGPVLACLFERMDMFHGDWQATQGCIHVYIIKQYKCIYIYY